MEKIVNGLDELIEFVYGFLDEITPSDCAQIIALSGDLGAGKTAFTKVAGKYFDINEEMTSPTFVIQKEYLIDNHRYFKKLIHIDAYRLASASELEYLGWNEMIKNPENIIFIEWPEQVSGINLNKVINVTILIQEDFTRRIRVKKQA